MKTLRTILQIPVLLLILYLGSVSGSQLIRDVQHGNFPPYDWRSYAHIVLGVLEIVVLIWVYRRLDPNPAPQRPHINDAKAN
jgi:hypothetical protein